MPKPPYGPRRGDDRRGPPRLQGRGQEYGPIRERRPKGAPRTPFRTVFEDDDIVIVDKPSGMLSATPSGSREDSVFTILRRIHAQDPDGERGLWIIHRLDRDASGLLVFAKSRRAFNWLKEDFRSRRVRRVYHALVEGERRSDEPEQGVVQSFLREQENGSVVSVNASRTTEDPGNEDDRARLAVSYYRFLASGQGHALIEVRMDSGRKHQIRVHMKDIGHVISGDQRYGARGSAAGRLTLHATHLEFRHPASGQTVVFESPPAPGFWLTTGTQPPVFTPPPLPNVMRPAPSSKLDTSFEGAADAYDAQLEGEGADDHFEKVIIPGALRLLSPAEGMRVLDLASGQGILCRLLTRMGCRVAGIDASPSLIELARSRGPSTIEYAVGDARELGAQDLGVFDAVTCIMALMNIDPLDPVAKGIADKLVSGGRFVAVILHPAFRAPRQSSWGEEFKGSFRKQFRRVDGYLTPGQFEIVMNPGEVAHGGRKQSTWTFHRPLQNYVKALSEAGLLIESIEEWPSLRRNAGGRQSQEFNRIRREIPLFMGIRAVKR